ncbi:hypothetical protein EDC96DRAFT_503859 [Choanephora cucurbitarum]|nr:hypothetical protein EDC96DRAFT_503859 [Choanephora cucurbitarum]
MVSIFKAIQENDIQLLNYFIDLSIGEQQNTYPSIPKHSIQWLQQQLRISGQKYYDINKRSTKGRTPLHCAVTWNRTEIAQALISCPQVNVNLRDRENGWTALHRSLYMGNIEIARMLLKREDIDLDIVDWEGLSAFDLFDHTMPDTYPKERVLSKQDELSTETREDQELQIHMRQSSRHALKGRGGTDLYTWGHNTNYVLGHPDSENRTRPERVKLQLESQQSRLRPNYVIESVVMSKYHMAILTSDSSHNLLVCGFGRGGRLGLGKDLDTQFIPTAVQWPERIVSVALGRDHTVAVTENGNVITFGNNEYGQLGYEIDNHNKAQLVPRKIQAQSLKKQSILGAAASRVHSVVFTSTDIFTFGLNQGQLGYQQPDNDTIQTSPRKVSMSTEIVQVIANDNATVILNKSHEIILLCNYTQQKLFLPVNRFPRNIVVHRSEPIYATQLVSSGSEHLGAITNTGDVFMWTCRSLHARNSERRMSACATSNKHTTSISTPKSVWTLHKAHQAAVDASIGQHGEIVICTLSGHVFVGRSEANGYKFNHLPHLQRCIKVCANSSGAFAAIRSEYALPATIAQVAAPRLEEDLVSALPHTLISKELQAQVQMNLSRMQQEIAHEKSLRLPSTMQEEEVIEHHAKREAEIKQRYNDTILSLVEKTWSHIDDVSTQDDSLDIVFVLGHKHLYCHSSILRCRSKLFKQLVHSADRVLEEDLAIKVRKTGDRIEIHFGQCQTASLLLLLDYLYTDQYEHPMKAFFQTPALCFTDLESYTTPPSTFVKSVQKNLVTLARLFDLPHLLASAQSSFGHVPHPTLRDHLRVLMESEKDADVILETQPNHANLKCHQLILRQRCSFFANLTRPNSVWTETRRQESKDVAIEVSHIAHNMMQTIVRHIYLDEGELALLDDIETEKDESMMQFLLDLLCEADYLLLGRLKTIAEKALIHFIRLRSVPHIFECADTYLAENLKMACLQFISVNLPVFLRTNMLDSLAVSLIQDLEAFIRQLQTEVTPLVARGEHNVPTNDILPEEEDTEFSSSIYALSKGDGSVTLFDEVLTTLYPEKTPKQKTTTRDTPIKSPPLQKADSFGKTPKRGVRVALDELEQATLQQDKIRRPSVGWAPITTDDIASSSTKLSLREIIETENKPATTTAVTNDHFIKSPKPTLPKKISQKERKRMVYQQELAATESSSPKPVWGKLPPIEVKPIPKQTEIQKELPVAPTDRKGKKVYISEEHFDQMDEKVSNSKQDIEKQVLFNPLTSLGPTFRITPIRQLNNKETKSVQVGASFESIQKQQQLEDSWIKGDKPKKNILRIQKEEQAIASIGQYYIQTLNIMSGEWCEIQRVVTR